MNYLFQRDGAGWAPKPQEQDEETKKRKREEASEELLVAILYPPSTRAVQKDIEPMLFYHEGEFAAYLGNSLEIRGCLFDHGQSWHERTGDPVCEEAGTLRERLKEEYGDPVMISGGVSVGFCECGIRLER